MNWVKLVGSAKHYKNTKTGEEISYRQALKRGIPSLISASKKPSISKKAAPIAKAAVKRTQAKGTADFWSDVKVIKRILGISHKEAIKKVKYSEEWVKRRAARNGKNVVNLRDLANQDKHLAKGEWKIKFEQAVRDSEYGSW